MPEPPSTVRPRSSARPSADAASPPGHGLARLFAPRSVVVVGASADPRKLSGRLHRHLGRFGFDGTVHLVNARRRSIDGRPTYASVADVPGEVDLALVVVPAADVLEVLAQCATKGVRFAEVFTSGFAEQDGAGAAAERRMLEVARASGMRIVGPNAEGFVNLVDGLAATFSPVAGALPPGWRPTGAGVAVVSQSGGLGFAVLDRGLAAGIEFSHVVSTGNEVDVELAEVVEYLVHDPATAVVVVVCEGLRRPDRLAPLAAAAEAAGKALVVAKLGRSTSGARAARAHTAHPTGRDEAYGAAFARCGVHRAADEEGLLDLAMLRSRVGPRPVRRVAVVTMSGGGGVVMADALEAEGLELPTLSPGLQGRLRGLMPAFGSPANPVDLTAQALSASGVSAALETVLDTSEVDGAVLVASLLNPLLLEHEGEAIARVAARSGKPLVLYAYTGPSPASAELLGRHRLAWFPSAARAARAIAALGRRTDPHAHAAVAAPSAAGDAGDLVAAGAVDWLTARGVVVAGAVTAPGTEAARVVAEMPARMAVRVVLDDDFGPLVTVGGARTMASGLAPLERSGARDLLVAAGGEGPRLVESAAGERLVDLVVAAGALAAHWAGAPAPPAQELWLDPVLVVPGAGDVEVGGVRVGSPGGPGAPPAAGPRQLHA